MPGTFIDFGRGLKFGFDTIYWETDWIDEGVGNMVRFDAYVMLNF